MMSQQPIRKLNKRHIYWCLVGALVLSLPAVISLASFGKKEKATEQREREAHPNLFAHDTKSITGTEHFPDTYSDVRNFENELATRKKPIEPAVEAEVDFKEIEITKDPSSAVHNNNYGRNEDPWHEAKTREQKQRASDYYDARRSDILFVNNLKDRKSANAPSDEDNIDKMMEKALAMEGRANSSLAPRDSLLIGHDDKNEQHANFLNSRTNGSIGTIKNPSKFMISEGTLIPAILLSEVNTDLPGPILARVSHNIWDSKTGQSLLIPQNSKLIGEYNSAVGNGQTRAQIVWTRIIYPNQQSVTLGRMVGVDKKVTSGATGTVDNHYDKVALALLMTTTLGAGVRMTQGKYDPNSATVSEDFGNSLAQETARVGNRIADKMLSIKPTITVPLGERLNVFVEQDLHLEPYSG